MTDRVPSNHDAVESHRVHLETVGATSRPRVRIPAAVEADADDVVRLSLEGTDSHARIERGHDGDLAVTGAFANARLARSPGEGSDRFAAWVDESGCSPGDALELDVVTPGYQFGLRRPGERVVYDARDPPADGLSDIARGLDGNGRPTS